MMAFKSSGQATVEYIFILAFVIYFGLNVTKVFSNFFRDSMGSVGHALSTHLMVGVCPQNCFYTGYKNGFEGGP